MNMSEPDLVEAVRAGLLALQDYRGAWTRVREDAGVSWTTLYRVASKVRKGHKYDVLRRIQAAVVAEQARHAKA